MSGDFSSNQNETLPPDFDQMAVEELLGYAREHAGACDVLFERYRKYFRVHLHGDARLNRFRSKVDSSDVLQTALGEASDVGERNR